MVTQEETNILVIEDTDGRAVNITMLNLAVEGSDSIAAVGDLIRNDSSSVVALLIPESGVDPDIIVKAFMAGARAYVRKPSSSKEIRKPARSEGREVMMPRETNILLVEDTEEHVALIRRALENGRLRPRLVVIQDGRSALDFLYNRGDYNDRETNPRPDVILLDLNLPKVHGLQVLKHIKDKEKLRDIPVVVITASDEGKDIIRSYQRGAESYFTKEVLFINKGADPTTILDTVLTMAGVGEN